MKRRRTEVVYEEIDFKELTNLVDKLGEEKIEEIQTLHRNFFIKGYKGAVASVLMYALGKAEGERTANENQQEKNAPQSVTR